MFDCVEDHLALRKQCFSFDDIKGLVSRDDFTFCYDSMSGVQELSEVIHELRMKNISLHRSLNDKGKTVDKTKLSLDRSES